MAATEKQEAQLDEFVKGAYILAVDDFSMMRRIIVTTLRAREAYVDEAANGLIALDKMRMACENNAPYDLVFLDIEMPVLDGIGLLKKIRSDPLMKDTQVIVLSSHADKSEIDECISLGITDYIIKPVTKDRLYHAVSKALGNRQAGDLHGRQAIQRNFGVHEAVASPTTSDYSRSIFQKLESIDNLPTLPTIVNKIKELTKDPSSNNERIAKIMEDDPSLMANVFKLANSAMYGAREPFDNLQAAITRLGLKTINNLATSMAVLSLINTGENEAFDHREYCRHSICVGIAMSVLYERCKEKIKDTYSKDFLHLAGLLHDIGKIIIIQFFQTEFLESIKLGEKYSIPLFLAEQKALGVDHAEVGAWLGRKWNLSKGLLMAIRYHHSPMLVNEEPVELAMLCHTANYICNMERIGNSGDTMTCLLDQRVAHKLGIKPSMFEEISADVRKESRQSEILMSLLD